MAPVLTAGQLARLGLGLALVLTLCSQYEDGVRERLQVQNWSSALRAVDAVGGFGDDDGLSDDTDGSFTHDASPARLGVDAVSQSRLAFAPLKICGRHLCIQILPTNITGVFRAPPRRESRFEMMYFPTIPRSGNTFTRKLWESTTGVASESVFREEKSFDRRTGAYYHKCGIALSSLGANEGDDTQCSTVHAPTRFSPALVKSHDKTFPRLDMVRKMTSLLIIVRNPLDNFVSDLLDRNRVFVDRALRRLANSTIPVKFTAPDLGRLRLPVVIPAKKWVPLIWVSYLNLWLFGNGHATCQTGKGRLLKKRRCKIPRVPTYVIRFEDLQRDPSAIMVDFLQSTGIASALNLTSERVKANVERVTQGTSTLDPGNAANCRAAFDFIAPSRADAQSTLALLQRYQHVLDRMGYAFELNDDEPQPPLLTGAMLPPVVTTPVPSR